MAKRTYQGPSTGTIVDDEFVGRGDTIEVSAEIAASLDATGDWTTPRGKRTKDGDD